MKISDLIQKIRTELYSKEIPGKLLNDIMEDKLKQLANRYPHDEEALWLGTYLADIRIVEAREQTGNHNNHVPMAVEYTKQIFREHNIPQEKQDIIMEIVEKHHEVGSKKYIESKLFQNADCFKFLEPKGALHLFGVNYIRTNQNFEESMQNMIFKAKEKIELVDLDEETITEAKMLFEKIKWMFDRTGVEEKVPKIYKK